MDLALVLSALLLGAAGAPHCAAMCGAACASVLRGCGGSRPQSAAFGFHLARVAGYAAAGALAASSVGVLAQLGQLSPVLRPLWTLLHCAALGLGVWLLIQGRQPVWLENIGRSAARLAPQQAAAGGWQPMQGPLRESLKAPLRAGAAGAAWVAWPCGLLQSALVVAALANSALGGAATMAAFAVASAAGIGLAPWAFGRLVGAGGGAWPVQAWAVRVAGAALAAASAWALGHDLFRRVVAYCLS
jgi:sulfite exporter TauE/SafE